MASRKLTELLGELRSLEQPESLNKGAGELKISNLRQDVRDKLSSMRNTFKVIIEKEACALYKQHLGKLNKKPAEVDRLALDFSAHRPDSSGNVKNTEWRNKAITGLFADHCTIVSSEFAESSFQAGQAKISIENLVKLLLALEAGLTGAGAPLVPAVLPAGDLTATAESVLLNADGFQVYKISTNTKLGEDTDKFFCVTYSRRKVLKQGLLDICGLCIGKACRHGAGYDFVVAEVFYADEWVEKWIKNPLHPLVNPKLNVLLV